MKRSKTGNQVAWNASRVPHRGTRWCTFAFGTRLPWLTPWQAFTQRGSHLGTARRCRRPTASRSQPAYSRTRTLVLQARGSEPESTAASGLSERTENTDALPEKRVLVQQWSGTSRRRIETYCDYEGKLSVQRQISGPQVRHGLQFSTEPLQRLLASVFLPTNYPHSVTASYAPYAFWHFLHNTLTACNSVLGTTALLVSAGVVADPSRAASTALTRDPALEHLPTAASASAVTSWILKDGVGHLVRLAFGSRYAHRFDGDLKRLRVLADVLWHLGTGLELVSRSFPDSFIGLASGAYALKGMAHVVFNSTRSTIYRTVATRSNIGDVTAKGDAQSIAAELLGMSIGLSLYRGFAENNLFWTWAIFGIVVAGQMYSRIQSMRVLVLPLLNLQRAVLLVDAYVASRLAAAATASEAIRPIRKQEYVSNVRENGTVKTLLVLSPEEVAQRERFLHWQSHWSTVPQVVPDVRMHWFSESASDVATLLRVFETEAFVVGRCRRQHPAQSKEQVGFVMKTGAGAREALRALIAAIFLVRQPQATERDALLFSRPELTEDFFREAASRGWQLDCVHGVGQRNRLLCNAVEPSDTVRHFIPFDEMPGH